MTPQETELLKALSSALSNESLAQPQDLPAVLSCASNHKVIPLLYDALSPCAEPIHGSLDQETRKTILQFWRLFFLTKQLCDLLEEHGIRVAVLKGISAAEDYPHMEYRKSGDVDLLIDASDMDKTADLLSSLGFQKDEQQRALHHIAFNGPDQIEVEVHTLFAEPFDNTETNHKLRYYSKEALSHVVHREIEGISFPLLDDTYQAFSLLMHMLQHYLRAGFGLKLLTDWSVFWNRRYTTELAQSYQELINDMAVDGFSDLVTSACFYELGLKGDHMPAKTVDREWCEAFLEEVFAGGEFGRSSTDRMVSLRGTGIFEYVREFHHQMRLNYPKLSVCILLWPILWILTLIRFLINNRTVRHTSTLEILKKTKVRSELNENIHLFQKKE